MLKNTRSITRLLLCASCTLPFAAPAYAQAQMTEPDFAEAEQDAIAEPAAGGNVILVTANKRSENLQDVPVAISVIGQEQLELTGFSDVKDLSALAPNVTVSEGTTIPTSTIVAIRGIASGSDEQLTLDQGVAVYLDGVYLARSAATAVPAHDIEAVEVLRGPQGTLFGRNSTGGAISFRLRRPTNDFGVDAEAGYGNQDSREALLRVNSGNLIDDNLRVSVTYLHRQNDGYVDNLLTPGDNKDPGFNNVDSIRAALEADLGTTGSVYYSFDYADFEGLAPAAQTVVASERIRGFLANSSTVAGCDLDIEFKRKDALCLDDALPSDSQLYGHVLKLENDFGGVVVRSTTGWRSWRSDIPKNDFDGFGPITGPGFSQASLFNGLPAELIAPLVGAANAPFVSAADVPLVTTSLFETNNNRKQNQISQELELVSDTSGRFNWVVGAFYFYEDSRESNPQQAGFVIDVDQTLRNIPNIGAALADALPEETRYRILTIPSQLDYRTTAESYAVYGQGQYRFGAEENLGLTIGLRYTRDRKTINQQTPFVNIDKASFSEPTGHVTVDYRVSDGINAYAKAARGYRSGGFNVRTQQPAFEPEILWSYEAGLKTEFWDRRARVNLAGFYAEYSDQQVNQPVSNPTGGGFGQTVVNAGSTEYIGVEADFFLEPIDNLVFSGSAGYVHREYKEFPLRLPSGEVIDISDQVLAKTNTPDTTINAAVQYRHNFGDDMFLLGRVGATYEGDHVFFTVPLTSPFTRDLESDAYTLVNAQIRLGDIPLARGARGFVQVWGQNLFDKEYESRAIDFGALGYGSFLHGRPRTYGITAGVSF
ncbi:TonB-dependent receptor [Croceicoccus sp. F390]|uniref:TonB-dependent receptor n=1 Tax=Croceicoccus esteveae TaxID=3075597 RepID=A0ABU2ZEG4_9SPHN|nr:TonB-dependent receptor [Croceicoccus sp. F390]MDT0574669.1 TonB-dependent receptor [Croceicoccus sp. F390]